MAVIETAGQLVTIAAGGSRTFGGFPRAGSVQLYNGRRETYAEIVRTQPNVRTVISFLSRNVAQLPVHLYEAVEPEVRERRRSHPFAAALRKPNPADRHLTRFRLIHNLVWDLCAFDEAFLVIVAPPVAAARPALVRVKPQTVEVFGNLWPTGYRIHGARGSIDVPPENMAHFQGSIDLDESTKPAPPIETLRRILAEDNAAGEYREQFWRSGARISGVIERPAEAPEWSTTARDRFAAEWHAAYTGHGPKAGGTPILEDGMTFNGAAATGDARSAQYVEARKLSREEAAAAFHVDPTWVGISTGSEAFASVKERRKALYQDTLGPWVKSIEEDFEAQVLPAFEADPETLERLYVKVQTAEKLRGTPDEQADALIKLTGRPIFEPNEARALLDRPPIDGGDGLTIPLNVVVGGQVSPGEPVVGANSRRRGRPKALSLTDAQRSALELEHRAAHEAAMVRTFERQAAEVLAELGARDGVAAEVADVFDRSRWDAELAADLFGLALATALDVAAAVADRLGFDDLDEDLLEPFLLTSTQVAAEKINTTTAAAIDAELVAENPLETVANVFAVAASSRAGQIAQTRFTSTAGFASTEAATQAGRSSKVWIVTSSNSRHPELDGETVPLGEAFSNGAQYPGDGAAGADATAGCTCALGFE